MSSQNKRRLNNTYVFKSFHDLLNEVHISSLRRKELLDVEGEVSCFGESLRKWRELNCTQQFAEFANDLQGKVDSLLLVIHNQKHIAKSLEHYLLMNDSIALEPLIDLTVQLSRDLQADFYENYFETFFKTFIVILNKHHHDVNIIKNIFLAFSFIFKSLQRKFLSDIEKTFDLFCPLLNQQKYRDYINNFAAEAFSFLMRKYKDMRFILTLVLKAVIKDNDLKFGISKLLFEMVKGLKHQFYSQTPQILSTLLDIAGEKDFREEIIEHLLVELWKLMCAHTKIEYSSSVVKCTLDKLSLASKNNGKTDALHKKVIIKLLSVLVKHKRGCYLMNEMHLIEIIQDLFGNANGIEAILLEVTAIILSSDILALHRSTLLALAYDDQFSFESVLIFTNSIFKISLFERDALIHLMKFCQRTFSTNPENVLHALTLFAAKKYDSTVCNREIFLKHVPEFGGYIEAIIRTQKDVSDMSLSEIQSIWAALVCLPLTNISCNEMKHSLEALIKRSISSAKCAKLHPQKKHLLCILKQAVKALICAFDDNTFLNADLLISLMSEFKEDEEALATIVMILNEIPHLKINNELFRQSLSHFKDNLLSPYSELRCLSLKILSSFRCQLPKVDGTEADQNVFQVCLEAEEISSNLSTYRDKLKCLQKLSCDAVWCRLPEGCEKTIPLRYLISQLHVNFQLLWEPVKRLISSYAECLEIDEFWLVFGQQLQIAEQRIVKDKKSDEDTEMEIDVSSISLEHLFHCDCFSMNEAKVIDRPNVLSFRENLWNCMLAFPARCERMADAIIPIFFQFLEEEYGYKSDIVLEHAFHEANRNRVHDKHLNLHLKLFAAFDNPHKFEHGKRLFNLYMELLQLGSVEVQKAAFTCLLTYKLPYLTPYRDNIERLIDEKTFKDEVIVFTFEEEKCTVHPVHRQKTIPIVLRILLGKMRMKVGKDANGRTLGTARINTILTYLSGFNVNEIAILLDLLFRPALHLTKNNIEDNASSIISGNMVLDIPFKKQESLVKNIELIFKKLGHKMDAYLHKILNILVSFGASCNHLLTEKRETFEMGIVNILKGIRSSVYGLLLRFFELFQTFRFETNHLQAIFCALVWPQLDKLPQDAVNNPTPLLKLLLCWSKYPRYHILLAKTSETNLCPFQVVLKITKGSKVDAAVMGMIYAMMDNLLDDEEMEVGNTIVPGSILDLSLAVGEIDMSCGTSIVVYFCNDVLDCIEKSLRDKQHSIKKSLNLSQQLSILSKLSCYVSNGPSNEHLCSLLISLMVKGCKVSSEDEMKILISIKNLIHHVEHVTKFIGSMSPLFEKITGALARVELCLILQEIAGKDPSYSTISEIVSGINAIDQSKLHEPDYVSRMSAFSRASLYLRERDDRKDNSDLSLLVPNCLFLLVNSPDRTLRERSVLCLEEVVKLCIGTLQGENFISQNFVPFLKKHLRHKVEDHRHSMIKLLQILSVHFEKNNSFKFLRTLCDFDDEEKDFFKNIVHIQLHRRTRALRKLSGILLSEKTIPTKALISYLLPIVLSFLKDQIYSKDHDLLTGAIEALSSISTLLPWNSYVQLLRDNLDTLTKTPVNQKLIVRIIVGIMDGFHFDLNNSQYTEDCISDAKEEEEETEIHPESKIEMTGEMFEWESKQATKIHRMMERSILPSLNKCLAQKAKSDDQHKLVKDKYAEDEEILRIPIAFAMIKLLQKLPKGSLERNLNGIVLKLCYFLGSRAEDIRNKARDTIKKALISLGPSYFIYFINALKAHLSRGYQIHVLCFSIWSIMEEMTVKTKAEECEFNMKAGDLNGCISSLNEIFHKELFTDVAEEKEVDAISRKLFEAKTTKSYDSYKLLSMWITVEHIPKLIIPLKEVLDQTNSHKVINKVSTCLSKISQGIIENKSLSVKFTLTFIYGLVSESLTNFISKEIVSNSTSNQRHGSCLIIETAPPRVGTKPKNDSKANLYVLIDFGLSLLHLMLKQSFLDMKEKQHLKMLEPFVLILSKSLDNKHTTVCISSLKCLMRLLRFPLMSISMHIKKIANKIFDHIKTYSTIGAGKNEHSEMVDWCFKTIQVLVQFVHCHNISEEQLHILLMYSERDLHDYSKHATAFPLLHAILCRKLNAPELPQIISTVEEMLIKSEILDVQNKCRKALMTYLLDYPIDSKVMENHMRFLARQLEFEYELGRLSALETINGLFKVFPQNILNNYSMMFFLQLAQSRLNDDSVRCINMASENLKLLLQKISLNEKEKILSIVFNWMNNPKPNVLMLMAMVMTIVVEVEGVNFNKHLRSVIPSLIHLIRPEAFQQKLTEDSELLEQDRLLFCFLDLILTILKQCTIIRDKTYAAHLNDLWGLILIHCKYDYEPVRLKASQLFNELLSSWTPKELVSSCILETCKEKQHREFLQIDFVEKIHSLMGTFSYQLSADLGMELANQVCGNLLHMLEILLEMPEHLQNFGDKKVSVNWLIKRICKETRVEVIMNRHSTVKRNSIFVWLAAVAEKLGSARISKHLKVMMKPLIRELLDNDPTSDAVLKTLAQQVLDLIKSVAGLEIYSNLYASLCNVIASKKVSTKAARSVQATTNPEAFAKRKIKKNLGKREAKKRKMDHLKPYRSSKKRKSEDI